MAGDRDRRTNRAVAVALALILGTLAFGLAPDYITDRDTYEQVGRQLIIPDCSNLHCTRVLVAWVIEQLPGDSLLKWKTYAVLGNLLAAWGIFWLSRRFGLDPTASRAAAVLSALGPGAQLTALDPHTSDPLIYGVAPWLVLLLLDGRFAIVTAGAVVGVWAKEFAAAPLWIFAAYGVLQRRTDLLVKSAAGATLASATWMGLQLWFILGYNYSYGGNSSARVLEGGYLLTWIEGIGPLRAIGAMVLHFGPLAWLAVAGFRRSSRELKLLALASVPALSMFVYVQQPDRAIWNFQFVLLPLAAVMFQGTPLWLRATWLTGYAVSHLPIDGGWQTVLVWSGFAVCAAVGAAMLAGFFTPRVQAGPVMSPGLAPERAVPRAWRATAVVSLVVLGALLVAAVDVAFHRRVESAAGFNVWGYRGPVVPQADLRVAVLGGRHMLGEQLAGSLPRELQEYLNNSRLRDDGGFAGGERIAVVNLAEPTAAVLSMQQTVEDAAYLRAAVICLYIGDEQPPSDPRRQFEGWRRQSWIYRTTGYLPALPSLFVSGFWPSAGTSDASAGEDDAYWQTYDTALEAAVVAARRLGPVLVATHPVLTAADAVRHDLAGARLRNRFADQPGFEYLDLRDVVDLSAPNVDGRIAESLSQAVFRLLRAR